MSAAFAVPLDQGAPRSVAVRRAVLTGLFLGGFLTLAFLFGGSAHAVSGVSSEDTSAVTIVDTTKNTAGDTGDKGADAGEDADTAPGAAGDPARSTTGGSGDEGGDKGADEGAAKGAAEAGAEGKGEGSGKVAEGPLAAEPSRQSSSPVAPERSGSRVGTREGTAQDGTGVLRSAAARQSAGGLAPKVLRTLTGTLASVYQQHLGDVLQDRSVGAQRAAERVAGTRPDGAAYDDGHPNGARQHGNSPSGQGAAAAGFPFRDAGLGDRPYGGADSLPAGQLPAHHAPTAPASHSSVAGDGGGPRGGADLHAAYVTGMARFGPSEPGAVRDAHGSPTREMAGDILEFPG